MELDFLYNIAEMNFISQLRAHTGNDYLSLEVAKNLDKYAWDSVNGENKIKLLMRYFDAQLDHHIRPIESHVDLTYVPSIRFNKDDSTLRLLFNLYLDFGLLRNSLSKAGYKIDIEPPTTIKIKMPTTFCDIHEFVNVLKREINKKPTRFPLLTDIFPEKAPTPAVVINQPETRIKAKL